MHMVVMVTFLHFENSNWRSDRIHNMCRSEERGLGEANTSSSPASDAAWYLFDWQRNSFECHVRCIAALAMKQVLVEEPNHLNTELWSVELSICSYKLSMHIYLFNFLPCMPCAPWSIHFLGCYIWHSSFALANTGLITHGRIYTCLGVILIRYAQYILALRVRYVHYTLACNARSLSSFWICPPFWISFGLATPFYMRMLTLHSTRIIFSTYSFNMNTFNMKFLLIWTHLTWNSC